MPDDEQKEAPKQYAAAEGIKQFRPSTNIEDRRGGPTVPYNDAISKVCDAVERTLKRVDAFFARKDASTEEHGDKNPHPWKISHEGKEFAATGKTGTRISNGAHAHEYESIHPKTGEHTGHRVWKEHKSGVIYKD